MHLIYVDEAYDKEAVAFSALAIPSHTWRECFGMLREFRRKLRTSDGVYLSKELHACKFVSGRGRPSDRIIAKSRRIEIYRELLGVVADLPAARCFNAFFPKVGYMRAFERLINRVNRTMAAWDSYALFLCDEGNERQYTKLMRRMGVYNPIPSQFGRWQDTGEMSRNIPIERIVEDPVFKDSAQSFLIQAVDFVAYSLLRRERPDGPTERYGASTAFDVIGPILVAEATRYDSEGILRP